MNNQGGVTLHHAASPRAPTELWGRQRVQESVQKSLGQRSSINMTVTPEQRAHPRGRTATGTFQGAAGPTVFFMKKAEIRNLHHGLMQALGDHTLRKTNSRETAARCNQPDKTELMGDEQGNGFSRSAGGYSVH
ncbi:hypothetical protein P7K49_010842 [Saguinus oedipus]|uniref:Uncharacterized protein n=1 Tax=Saguinus oedipus TaxID=9490 RepID=A0ABQ9VPN1_SAGOE|nr:hypothetical protein P7K49_010842 [Saguinus oedipus]